MYPRFDHYRPNPYGYGYGYGCNYRYGCGYGYNPYLYSPYYGLPPPSPLPYYLPQLAPPPITPLQLSYIQNYQY